MKKLIPCFFLIFAFSASAQVRKPSAKPKATPSPILKSQPSVIGEGTTKEGKRVVLKSDNTWEYIQVPVEVAQTKELEENKYLKIPLSVDATRLPRGYMGQGFIWLHSILRANKSFKSEFETTDHI